MTLNIYQSMFNILPDTKETLSKSPNNFKISPKRQNFAKSGHTRLHFYVHNNVQLFTNQDIIIF